MILRCRMPRAADAACSIRYAEHCAIYLGPQADACALTHERKHCAGYAHVSTVAFRQDCGV